MAPITRSQTRLLKRKAPDDEVGTAAKGDLSLPVPSAKRVKKEFLVSASSIRNIMIGNGMLSYMLMHRRRERDPTDVFVAPVPQQGRSAPQVGGSKLAYGREFERRVLQILTNVMRDAGHAITIIDSFHDAAYADTRRAIEENAPMIYQGALRCESKNTFGIPDLLVRRDILTDVLGVTLEPLQATYYVVDIKSARIRSDDDGLVIVTRKEDGYNAAQLSIYTDGLASLLHATPQNVAPRGSALVVRRRKTRVSRARIRYAFLLGRALGSGEISADTIHVAHFDYDASHAAFAAAADSSAALLRDMQSKPDAVVDRVLSGDARLSVPELLAAAQHCYERNLLIDYTAYNGRYTNALWLLGQRLGDIACIHGCGVAQRDRAAAEGIFSAWDPRLSAALLCSPDGNVQTILDNARGLRAPALAQIKTDLYGVLHDRPFTVRSNDHSPKTFQQRANACSPAAAASVCNWGQPRVGGIDLQRVFIRRAWVPPGATNFRIAAFAACLLPASARKKPFPDLVAAVIRAVMNM